MTFETFFDRRRVFITGHTGFKGAWLTQWLRQLGADICGYSLQPPTEPSLYDQLELDSQISSVQGDVNDLTKLKREISGFQPEVVFHLAAQSLVRESHQKPVDTFQSNAMGTVNLLESLRVLQDRCAAVIVTSDKCYENQESSVGYTEDDRLGGSDPYSASKAMSELAAAAYNQSFFLNGPIRLATARAGNVIGGGDWAVDRIVPDAMRSLGREQAVLIRNPHSYRPWQHVLDPLSGYLKLAAWLFQNDSVSSDLAFNFGPSDNSHQSVLQLVESIFSIWPGQWARLEETDAPVETMRLKLCTKRAAKVLQWRPTWDFYQAIETTTRWYFEIHHGASVNDVTNHQLNQFRKDFDKATYG